jgi:hypothetical protein
LRDSSVDLDRGKGWRCGAVPQGVSDGLRVAALAVQAAPLFGRIDTIKPFMNQTLLNAILPIKNIPRLSGARFHYLSAKFPNVI